MPSFCNYEYNKIYYNIITNITILPYYNSHPMLLSHRPHPPHLHPYSYYLYCCIPPAKRIKTIKIDKLLNAHCKIFIYIYHDSIYILIFSCLISSLIIYIWYQETMSTTAQRRLLQDLQKIKKSNDEGIDAVPDEDNLYSWEAVIYGPMDTIW